MLHIQNLLMIGVLVTPYRHMTGVGWGTIKLAIDGLENPLLWKHSTAVRRDEGEIRGLP
jgi:hypothetical protein